MNRCLQPYMELAESPTGCAPDSCGSLRFYSSASSEYPPPASLGRKRALSCPGPHAAKSTARFRRDVALSPSSIHVAAAGLAARFNHLLDSRLANFPATQAELRSWGRRCVRLGKDSSYGALERIAQAMDFDPEVAAEVVMAEAKRARHEEDGALEGGLCALHPGLRGLEDGSALVACYVQEASGRVALAMNAGFDAQLLSYKEALRELDDKHCLPLFLYGCIFAPESQAEFYASLGSLIFASAGDVSEVSLMLTVSPRHGAPFPSLVRMRHTVSPNGDYSSLVLSLIPLPSTEPCIPRAVRVESGTSHPLPPTTPDYATPLTTYSAPACTSRSISFRFPSPGPSPPQQYSPMTALHLLTLTNTPPPLTRMPSVYEVAGVLRDFAPNSSEDAGGGLEGFAWDDEEAVMVPTPAGGIGAPIAMPTELL